jgi:hypothetical protein
MRDLWAIEREILAIAATEYPASAEAIRLQAATAQVVDFKNTGVGFFSDLAIAENVPTIVETSPLDSALGTLPGIEHGMGFLVFLKEGRLSMIEGYVNGDGSTTGIDFSKVAFKLSPWSTRDE